MLFGLKYVKEIGPHIRYRVRKGRDIYKAFSAEYRYSWILHQNLTHRCFLNVTGNVESETISKTSSYFGH